MSSFFDTFNSAFVDSSLLQVDNLLSPAIPHAYLAYGSSATSDSSGPADSPSRSLGGPEHAGTSRSLSSSPAQTLPASGRKRNRPKVDLAPGQPPTARGNPRVRVFVACYQCRARKIRCDGAKPICCNCLKRSSDVGCCSYDSGPNRRGREKGVATRARGAAGHKSSKPKLNSRDRPLVAVARAAALQKEVSHDSDSALSTPPVEENNGNEISGASHDMEIVEGYPLIHEGEPPFISDSLSITYFTMVQESTADINDRDEAQDDGTIPPRPGSHFARDTWWDALLSMYATDNGFGSGDMLLTSINQAQRTASMKAVVSDLRALFQASPCWVSFLHLPRFFDTLFSSTRRTSLQPSVMFAALALGTFAQSSEAEFGAKGRAKSLRLLDMAYGAIEASLATGWVDIGLAQAALIIVFFEMQSHPQQSVPRSQSALLLLDSLFRLFGLTKIDENLKPRGHSPYATIQPQGYNPAAYMSGTTPHLPTASYGITSPNTIPVSANGTPLPHQDGHSHSSLSSRPKCNCVAMSLGQHWPSVHTIAPPWAGTMMWPSGLSEADFRREECRRLVWNSVMVLANLNAFTSAVPDLADSEFAPSNYIVREPENFSLLFPREVLSRTGAIIEDDDIWTLSYRTMLLMHVCMRTREDPNLCGAERAQLSVQMWMEIEDIEERLARHDCELDISFGFQAKELLFGLRMLTSYEFQRYMPHVSTSGNALFFRDKAEAWLKYTDETGQMVWKSLIMGAESPYKDHRKSLLVYWFVANIRKALALWKADKNLIHALEFGKRFSSNIECLMLYWPNLHARRLWQSVRMSLVESCLHAGISPPETALPRAVPKMYLPPADFDICDLMM